jgi:adenylate cyclase
MPRTPRTILAGLVPFVATGLVFGILYNTLFYPRTLVEYLEAGTIGVLLGVAAGLAEQHAGLERWMRRRTFVQAMAVRTITFWLAVASTLALVLSIEPATLGDCSYAECVARYVGGPLFVRDLLFSIVFLFFAVLFAQIIFLVGARNFARTLVGRYRGPLELRAEFMFVDLRGSTTIAERLGHERYSAFLRDFFVDISAAIHEARGEIYQYVGDEVVIVWREGRTAGRWVDCFAGMRAAIAANGTRYAAAYGVIPEFKAGVHAGAVVATEVGALRRAYVYHGDVLNTAARIQSKCNETGYDLLASREALASVPADQRSGFEPTQPLELRGKTERVDVFGMSAARAQPAAR